MLLDPSARQRLPRRYEDMLTGVTIHRTTTKPVNLCASLSERLSPNQRKGIRLANGLVQEERRGQYHEGVTSITRQTIS